MRLTSPSSGGSCIESWLSWQLLAQWLSRGVGALFILAAMSKALDSSGVIDVLKFMGLSERNIQPAVWGLVLFELVLGQALIFGWGRPWMTAVAIVVLLGFSVHLGYLLSFDSAPPCGCLAIQYTSNSARTINIIGIVRNVLLISALAIVFFPSSVQRSVTDASR